MIRHGVWVLALLTWACATRKQSEPFDTDAGSTSPPLEGDAGSIVAQDGDPDDAEDAASEDAGTTRDGGSDAGTGCVCVRGTCEDASCRCDEGYGGDTCDQPLFAGTGRDGALSLSSSVELTSFNHAGRSCADGGDAVAYNVVAFDGARAVRVAQIPAAGCLEVGDEVLLANLQGTNAAHVNVGHAEFLEVAEVTSDLVRFSADKRLFYGAQPSADDGVGQGQGQQRVILQRVPHYTDLTIPTGRVLSVRAWDGQRGGVLALRVSGRMILGGRVDLSSRGYQGGGQIFDVNSSGEAGEGPAGLGTRTREQNGGGGGGGAGDGQCGSLGYAGAGGAHTADGQRGPAACSGFAGTAYGRVGQLDLGAGGGSGGTDNQLSDNPPGGRGGVGGGALQLFARELFVFGSIDARGGAGQGDTSDCAISASTVDCWDFSGPGGGGAGGSIELEAEQLSIDALSLVATGGAGGDGRDANAGDGGRGGDGRIVIRNHGEATTVESMPPATLLP